MSYIMNLKSQVLSGLSWKTGIALLAAIATMLVLVPRSNSVTKAENCPNPPDRAVLNYWPVSFSQTQTECTDFVTLDGKVVGASSYSTSQADHDNGIDLADGQEAYLLAYVHNGAAVNGDPELTTARNVRFTLNMPTSAGSSHTVTGNWRGDNTNTANGRFVINTPANRTLELVPNSGQLYDSFGNQLQSGIDLSSGTYNLGDQIACFEYARFLRFKVKLGTPAGTPALSITKQVRNVTTNGTLGNSATAVTGNTVAYQIKVKNTGTAPAVNTTVTDNGTSGTAYIAGSLQVSNGGTGTGIPGTINLGTLAPNEEVTINYTATVTGDNGTYTNTATAQATSVNQVSANATVTVNNPPTSDDAECVSISLNPASPFTPGQSFTGTIRVRNNGTTTWAPGTYALGSQAPANNNTWGTSRVTLANAVAPGSQATFTVTTQAPTTAGTYSFAWQMVQNNNFFGSICSTPVVVNPIVVDSDDATCVAVTLTPASPFDPNQTFRGSIKIRNTGNTTWVPANGYALGSQNPANNTTWGTSRVTLPHPVAPGQEVIINIDTQAPSTPGNYTFAWQMVKNNNYFGATCSTPVVVKTPPVLVDNAECVSVTLNPASPFTSGQSFTGTIRVRNNGTTTWMPGTYALGSQVPANNTIWGTNRITLNSSVTPGNEVTFTLNTQAPSSTGSYNFAWQMVKNDGFFGATCQTPVVVNPPAGTPALSITKLVRNLNLNNAYTSSTPASTGDVVAYQIKVKNTGNANANNVTVTDNGTSGTLYVGGSLQVSNGGTGTGIPGTINLGTLTPGQEVTITYTSGVTGGAGTYTNTATAQATSVAPVSSTASVIVSPVNTNNAECIEVTLSPASPFRPNQGFIGTIRVRNTGNTTWAAGTYALGSQSPQDNTTWGTARIGLASSVAPGSEATFTLSTQAPSATGSYNFAWQMVAGGVYFGGICQTPVVVQNDVPQNTTLTLTKYVRNVTDNTSFEKTVNADNNDTVQYEIKIRNTGSVTANNVTMTDNGTSGTSFISGSIEVTGASNLWSGTIPGTLTLGNLAVNGEITIRYSMRVTGGNGTYTNTATAQASNATSVSDTARVVVDQGCTSNCGGGGGGTPRRLAVDKLVRNLTTGGTFRDSISASNGDRVEFEITVRNTGSSRLNNVRLRDTLPSGLRLVSDSIEIDGDEVDSDSLTNIDLDTIAGREEKVVTLTAIVDRGSSSSCSTRSLQNIARASASNSSSDQDDATVTVGCVSGSNVNLQFSKRAWNDTKNADATTITASREDFITYTLVVRNTGNSTANDFVITDDLSGVLSYADMVDRNGGTLNGNTLSYPGINIPAGGTVTKTFKVRIKHNLSQGLSYQLLNTYGNTVTINVGSVQGTSIFVAPTTGAAGTSAAAFAGLLTLGFVAYRKRNLLKRLVMA